MRPGAFPNRTGQSLHSSRIGSQRDVLHCLRQVTTALMPGDSLVLFLDREQQVLTSRRIAPDPFCSIGPPIQVVFREALAHGCVA